MLYALFQWLIKLTAWPVYYLCMRTKIHYEDKKVQGRTIKGKAIVASNHRSVYDVGQMMFLFFTRTLRPVVAEILYTKNFIFTAFLKLLGCIKVDRNAYDVSFINKSASLLQKGKVIEIYPEARLAKEGEERPLPFTASTVYLALETDAPIIPVYTEGSYFVKTRNHVIVGKPFYARDFYDSSLSHSENVDKITTLLRNKIVELGKELERRKEKSKKA